MSTLIPLSIIESQLALEDKLEALGVDVDLELVHRGVQELQKLCYQLSKASGWWSNKDGSFKTPDQVNVPEKLCLVHSEVSEAMEGHRKDKQDEHLPHRKSFEVELGDAMIRMSDLAGYTELDLAGAIIEKLAYNQTRADHKLENRNKEGGKAY